MHVTPPRPTWLFLPLSALILTIWWFDKLATEIRSRIPSFPFPCINNVLILWSESWCMLMIAVASSLYSAGLPSQSPRSLLPMCTSKNCVLGCASHVSLSQCSAYRVSSQLIHFEIFKDDMLSSEGWDFSFVQAFEYHTTYALLIPCKNHRKQSMATCLLLNIPFWVQMFDGPWTMTSQDLELLTF